MVLTQILPNSGIDYGGQRLNIPTPFISEVFVSDACVDKQFLRPIRLQKEEGSDSNNRKDDQSETLVVEISKSCDY